MSTFNRLVIVILVVLLVLAGANHLWQSMQWSTLATMLGGRIEASTPSTAYVAVDDQWLDFPLNRMGKTLRVRNNAIVDAQAPHEPGALWWYAFEYQLLDSQGTVLRQGRYNHRTRLSRFQDPSTGEWVTRNFLLDPMRLPTDGRSMLLSYLEEEQPSRLRIRLVRADPALMRVMFRVYEQVPNPAHERSYLWQRLSETQKARLARGSVYGPDHLREPEKHNLLRFDWQAVGPTGIDGEQYEAVKLYIGRAVVGDGSHERVVPHGLYVDGVTRGIIPLPEGKWKVKLSVIPLPDEQAQAVRRDIKVRWYGRGIANRWQTTISPGAGEHLLDGELNGGLIEIITGDPTVVRARIVSGDTEADVTPNPIRLRTYRADSEGNVVFDVDHIDGKATPMRVDLRALVGAEAEAVGRSVRYEMLDASGASLAQGTLEAQLIRSAYDHPSMQQPKVYVTDPARYYFNLPPRVAALRLSASDELLITAYSRPPDLVRETRVPEDYLAFAGDGKKDPGWFLLRPRNAEWFQHALRFVPLIIQDSPPEQDPRLLAGHYDWEFYKPLGSWRGRYLLIPRDSGLPERDQSRAALFRELPAGRASRVAIRGPIGRREVQPTMVFVRQGQTPMEVSLTLDGEDYYRTQIAGSLGELQLPPLTPGRHSIKIQASGPARWYINYTAGGGPALLRRLSMQLDRSGLEFVYHKQSNDREVLTGELFTQAPGRARLLVSIATPNPPGLQPLDDWTFKKRRFDLKPKVRAPVLVLRSSLKTASGGQRFVLPLGTDLPAGKYRIRVALEDNTQGYLTLYRLIAGQLELRSFFQERTHG